MKSEDEIDKAIAAYAKSKQVAVPKNLDQKAWKAVDQQRTKKSTRIIQWTIAASFAVLCFLTIAYQVQQKSIAQQNKLLFEEALSLFDQVETAEKAPIILYKDELVVIYLDPKK